MPSLSKLEMYGASSASANSHATAAASSAADSSTSSQEMDRPVSHMDSRVRRAARPPLANTDYTLDFDTLRSGNYYSNLSNVGFQFGSRYPGYAKNKSRGMYGIYSWLRRSEGVIQKDPKHPQRSLYVYPIVGESRYDPPIVYDPADEHSCSKSAHTEPNTQPSGSAKLRHRLVLKHKYMPPFLQSVHALTVPLYNPVEPIPLCVRLHQRAKSKEHSDTESIHSESRFSASKARGHHASISERTKDQVDADSPPVTKLPSAMRKTQAANSLDVCITPPKATSRASASCPAKVNTRASGSSLPKVLSRASGASSAPKVLSRASGASSAPTVRSRESGASSAPKVLSRASASSPPKVLSRASASSPPKVLSRASASSPPKVLSRASASSPPKVLSQASASSPPKVLSRASASSPPKVLSRASASSPAKLNSRESSHASTNTQNSVAWAPKLPSR